jgi:prolipoprotein diacylglyceryltransferase
MKPILFRWRGLTVWSYPAMIYLGLVAGVVAGNVAAHAARINAFAVYVATLILVPIGMIGAKLLYVATHWQQFRNHPLRIWDRTQGGAALYGGLILVLPLSLPLLSALHLSADAFWDVQVFTLLTLMIFGRVGCLMNGCCVGRPSQFWIALHLPDRSGVWRRRIPTQCLEAAWAALLLIFALLVRTSLPFAGALFLLTAAGYAGGRMVLESTRESRAGIRGFTIHHVLSALLIVLSISALAARWPRVN